MNKHLTITFFGFSPLTYGGGYETYIMKVIEKLSKNGHKINIVTGNQKINDYIHVLFFHKLWEKRISKNDISKKLPNVKLYEYSLSSLLPVSRSFKDIRNIMINSDIIYVKNELVDFSIMNRFCGKYIPTIVCGVHTSIIYPNKKSLMSKFHNLLYKLPIYRRWLSNCSVILTQNKFDTELLESVYNIEKKKIIKLLPFVDTEFFHFINSNRTDNKFKILFAGRLTEQKGIDILCKSIENISKLSEFDDMNITIAGSGELEYMIKELVYKYDNVKFLGFVSDIELIELYNSHDVIILPSRWETALKVVLEAQACGLPVIVSDIPGPNELIVDEKTGFLTKPESNKISNNILKIFQLKKIDDQKYLEMRNLSIKNAQKYSIYIVIEKLENIFYNLS